MYVNGYNSHMNPHGYHQPFGYHHNHHLSYNGVNSSYWREQTITGDATWTNGGTITKCGLPWTMNQSMTVAVSEQSRFRCGDTLKVRNRNTQREITVTVVDTVRNFPENRLNLHNQAFQALGANLDEGVIPIDIIIGAPEEDRWAPYVSRIVQTAYPNYQLVGEELTNEVMEGTGQIRRDYQLHLQSSQERIGVLVALTYNPALNHVRSLEIQEINR